MTLIPIVSQNQLVEGHLYQIADVDGIPGFTGAVFLGREPEGGELRFALENSQKVICVGISRLYLLPMTEIDWLKSTTVDGMLAFLGCSETQSRRQRLFGVACCRLLWEHLRTPESREAVERLENYSVVHSPGIDLMAVLRQATIGIDLTGIEWRCEVSSGLTGRMSEWARLCARAARTHLGSGVGLELADMLRDLCGPQLFRPIAFDSSWRTVTVDAIARGMYDWRDFSHMPILADALEDAGCTSEMVLDHCRSGRPHVRGCWVVDLILGNGVEANDAVLRWLVQTCKAVTTGPLIYYKCHNYLIPNRPSHSRVVDRSDSPRPRTVGDLLALSTGRKFGESYRDRFVNEFWEEGLLTVNQVASISNPEDWIAIASR